MLIAMKTSVMSGILLFITIYLENNFILFLIIINNFQRNNIFFMGRLKYLLISFSTV
jgi:hypothetical protein